MKSELEGFEREQEAGRKVKKLALVFVPGREAQAWHRLEVRKLFFRLMQGALIFFVVLGLGVGLVFHSINKNLKAERPALYAAYAKEFKRAVKALVHYKTYVLSGKRERKRALPAHKKVL